jgi:hypothetical protein
MILRIKELEEETKLLKRMYLGEKLNAVIVFWRWKSALSHPDLKP